jgi:hypothetical protein
LSEKSPKFSIFNETSQNLSTLQYNYKIAKTLFSILLIIDRKLVTTNGSWILVLTSTLPLKILLSNFLDQGKSVILFAKKLTWCIYPNIWRVKVWESIKNIIALELMSN